MKRMDGKPGKSMCVCVCVKQQAAMTQDKGSATIAERLETDTETATQAGGSGPLLIKSTEFQVYHLESTQARQRFFTLRRNMWSLVKRNGHFPSASGRSQAGDAFTAYM